MSENVSIEKNLKEVLFKCKEGKCYVSLEGKEYGLASRRLFRRLLRRLKLDPKTVLSKADADITSDMMGATVKLNKKLKFDISKNVISNISVVKLPIAKPTATKTPEKKVVKKAKK